MVKTKTRALRIVASILRDGNHRCGSIVATSGAVVHGGGNDLVRPPSPCSAKIAFSLSVTATYFNPLGLRHLLAGRSDPSLQASTPCKRWAATWRSTSPTLTVPPQAA